MCLGLAVCVSFVCVGMCAGLCLHKHVGLRLQACFTYSVAAACVRIVALHTGAWSAKLLDGVCVCVLGGRGGRCAQGGAKPQSTAVASEQQLQLSRISAMLFVSFYARAHTHTHTHTNV